MTNENFELLDPYRKITYVGPGDKKVGDETGKNFVRTDDAPPNAESTVFFLYWSVDFSFPDLCMIQSMKE